MTHFCTIHDNVLTQPLGITTFRGTKIEPSTVQNNIEGRHATHKGAA